MKIKPLKLIHAAKTPALLESLPGFLGAAGYKVTEDDAFVYGEGHIPLLLVAHVDTAHYLPPAHIYYDAQHKVMWSPQGLGADDRAGVAMIVDLIQRGSRPHVLFTDDEERGCRGARQVLKKLAAPKVNALIELDRANGNDAAFYGCANPAFTDWVREYGYAPCWGTFTDITVLAPEWGIAATNLSVGYYNQHTRAEHLALDEWRRTRLRVEKMLTDPPATCFEYMEAPKKAVVITHPTVYRAVTGFRGEKLVDDDVDYGVKICCTVRREDGSTLTRYMSPSLSRCDWCFAVSVDMYAFDGCHLCLECYRAMTDGETDLSRMITAAAAIGGNDDGPHTASQG